MNESALLAAVHEAIGDTVPYLPDGMTCQEMLAQTPDASLSTIQRAVKRLSEEGKLVAGWKHTVDGAGRRQRAPSYKMKEE